MTSGSAPQLRAHSADNKTRWAAIVAWFDQAVTPARVRNYPVLFLLAWVGLLIPTLLRGNPPLDANGLPIAVDLTAHVTGGVAVLEGQLGRLYDAGYQQAVQNAMLAGKRPDFLDLYLSPPFVAYLYVPFALLPYLAAAAVWTALTIGLLVASLRLLWPLIPHFHSFGFRRLLIVVFSTQPVFELIGDGQDTAITLLLYTLGLRLLLARRDVAAGAILGLGVFKPQLFLLIPVLLLFSGRWKALASWVGVAGVLTAISVAMIGGEGIQAYRALLGSDLYQTGIARQIAWKMQSVAALYRSFLPSALSEPAAFASFAAGGAFLAWLSWQVRRTGQTAERVTLLFAAMVLLNAAVTTHLFVYDLTILLLPACVLAHAAPRAAVVRLSLVALYLLTWTASLRSQLIAQQSPLLSLIAAPWTVLPVFCLLWASYWLLFPSRASARITPFPVPVPDERAA